MTAKKAIAEKAAKRVAVYKSNLMTKLPFQVKLWSTRETRLLSIITGSTGISIAALLIRECPDPPVEVDPDTDDESKQEDEHENTSQEKTRTTTNEFDDPTIQPWNSTDAGNSH